MRETGERPERPSAEQRTPYYLEAYSGMLMRKEVRHGFEGRIGE